MRAAKDTRVCRLCETEKPLTEFHRNRARRGGGRAYDCAVCANGRIAARQVADPQGQRERHKRWRDANAAHVRDYGRTRTSRRRALIREAFVEDVDPLVVLEMDDGVCGVCGKDVDPFVFDVDHIVPLERGGEHSYANTQAAHDSCNSTKQARLPWSDTGNGPDAAFAGALAAA